MGNRNSTIQRNWQHMVHKKTINQKHNIRKQAQTTQTRHQPPTNNLLKWATRTIPQKTGGDLSRFTRIYSQIRWKSWQW